VPSAPAAPPAAPAASAKATPEDQLRQMLAQWVKAWEGKNLNSYISYYAPDFRAQGMDREAWRKHKAYLNNVYKIIGVEARDVRVEMVGTKARVIFTQHYRSDWHRDVGRKSLELVLRGGHWQITRENWEALPGRG
jgi:ketosteroid isomerase-like protein